MSQMGLMLKEIHEKYILKMNPVKFYIFEQKIQLKIFVIHLNPLILLK